jgi:hypothetical protein
LSSASMGQAAPGSEAAAHRINDWSYHHVIFSKPATAALARRLEKDPRYRQQIRRQALTLPRAEASRVLAPELRAHRYSSGSGGTQGLKRDWAQDMGSGATVGAGNYPAKFSFDLTTASCANDFAVYNTGLLGSSGTGGQPSILAYNNVYTACEGDGLGTSPAVYWSYYTGGQIQTSPAFSFDGSQLAFVQTTGGVASLVLLKWAAGSGLLVAPVTPASNSGYPSCAAPCMTSLPLVDASVAADDTQSSVFYDYGDDAAYVGDDSGFLHKFKPVFKAAPAEVTSGGWPVKVNSSTPTALTDPVYDSGTGNVFVEDVGGFLYLVSSTAGVTQSGQLDFSFDADSGPGFVQGPIVDSSAGLVYAFVTSDGTGLCPGGVDCSGVYQFNIASFSTGDLGSEAVVGSSTLEPAPPNPIYIGAFDNQYENSADPPTGNLYVCGNTGANPILYRIPIAAGIFGTVVPIVAPTPSTDSPACSPVTDVSNPNTSIGTAEQVFFSVQDDGLPTLCGGIGCAVNFVDLPWQATTGYNVGQEILVIRAANNTPFVEVAITAGNSGLTQPAWPASPVGATTTDNGITWLNQGAPTLTPLPTWQNLFTYHTLHTRIVDRNGNVEILRTVGTSGLLTPAWSTTAGGITHDGATLTWTNAGALPSAALTSTGGTSGFVIDNVVNPLTFAGASQVYFSTLQDQVCVAGTGGCAVQASQAELQ